MDPVEQQQAASPRPVITYASVAEANRRAQLAVVWGALSVIPLAFPGIMAIRYGRAGVRDAAATGSGSGRARLGLIMGVVGLVWSAVFLAALPPALINARRQAEQVQCMSNLRILGVTCIMYANANRGYFPPNLAAVTGMVQTCPAAGGKASGAYVYIPPSGPVGLATTPWAVPLAYEPLANHGGRGINVLYADGHVAWMPAGTAAGFIASVSGPAGGPTTAPAGQ